jgi:hypothetical protein
VIRGALILAAGLAIGYGKGIQENVVALNKIEDMVKQFNAWIELQPSGNNSKPKEERPSDRLTVSELKTQTEQLKDKDHIPTQVEELS